MLLVGSTKLWPKLRRSNVDKALGGARSGRCGCSTTKASATSNFKNVLLCKRGHESELSMDLKLAYSGIPVHCSVHDGWCESTSKELSLESTWATQILPDCRNVSSPSNAQLATHATDTIRSRLKHFVSDVNASERFKSGHWNWDIHAISTSGTSWQSKMIALEPIILSHLKKTPLYKHRVKQVPNKPKILQEGDLLVQCFLKEADTMAVSVFPLTKSNFYWNKPFPWPSGYISIPADKKYPAESYMKVKEILLHSGIEEDGLTGMNVIELGATPGGWSMVLLEHGAILNTVDWADLTDPWIVNHQLHTHHRADARIFNPVEASLLKAGESFDFLFADLALPPEKSIIVFNNWLQNRWTKRFAWTFKFGFHAGDRYAHVIHQLRTMLQSHGSSLQFSIRHIYKHENEIVVLGGWIT